MSLGVLATESLPRPRREQVWQRTTKGRAWHSKSAGLHPGHPLPYQYAPTNLGRESGDICSPRDTGKTDPPQRGLCMNCIWMVCIKQNNFFKNPLIWKSRTLVTAPGCWFHMSCLGPDLWALSHFLSRARGAPQDPRFGKYSHRGAFSL